MRKNIVPRIKGLEEESLRATEDEDPNHARSDANCSLGDNPALSYNPIAPVSTTGFFLSHEHLDDEHDQRLTILKHSGEGSEPPPCDNTSSESDDQCEGSIPQKFTSAKPKRTLEQKTANSFNMRVQRWNSANCRANYIQSGMRSRNGKQEDPAQQISLWKKLMKLTEAQKLHVSKRQF
jgi:hypothetical protein